jgi:hypothetical protein
MQRQRFFLLWGGWEAKKLQFPLPKWQRHDYGKLEINRGGNDTA